MKTVEMLLQDGRLLTLSNVESFDLISFASALNNNNILAVNVNSNIYNKQLILAVIDKVDQTPNIKVSLNNIDILGYAENFNAEETTKEINDLRTPFTIVGNIIFNKRGFKTVEPI